MVAVALTLLTLSISVVQTTVAPNEAAAAQETCTPDPNFSNCLRFTYTGADQFFGPLNVRLFYIQVWGAGGGGPNSTYFAGQSGGGGGGYSAGMYAAPWGQLTIRVGAGGIVNSTSTTYGGGGAGGNSATAVRRGGSGGGLSGVFTESDAAVIVAGGGGGSSPGASASSPQAGGGGGSVGGQDGAPALSGRGGTQSVGGAAATGTNGLCSGATSGTSRQGGSGGSGNGTGVDEGGGGGGGGYFGGGGGSCEDGTHLNNGMGGGGSSYLASANISSGSTTAGSSGVANGVGGAAAGTGSSQYRSGVGIGGSGAAAGTVAGHGLVVLQWNAHPQVLADFYPRESSSTLGSTLRLSITNSNSIALTGAGINEVYPAGLVNKGSPNASSTCTGGSLTAVPGGNSLIYSGGTFPPGGCVIQVDVTGPPGTFSTGIWIEDVTTAWAGGNSFNAGASLTLGTVQLTPTLTMPGSLTAGTAADFDIAVNNAGTATNSAQMKFFMPAYVQFNSFTAPGWTCAAVGPAFLGFVVTCDLSGSIGTGATSSIRVNATPQSNIAGTSLVFRARVGVSGAAVQTTPACVATGNPIGCAVGTRSVVQLNLTADTGTTFAPNPITTNVLANDSVTPSLTVLNPASVTVSTAPLRGSTTVNSSTGAITFTPAAGYSGTDSYTYRVCDTSVIPVCGTAVVSITINNLLMVVNDSAITSAGVQVSIPVLANDSATGLPFDLSRFTIGALPAHGTAAATLAGNAIYTPAAGFAGLDSFTYRVCDTGVTCSAFATVTVRVENFVFANADSVSTAGAARVISVLANDSVSASGTPLDPTSVQVTSAPTIGTTSVNPVTGTITYTPTAAGNSDSFDYQVCDVSTPTPVCGSATVTVFIAANVVTAVPDAASTPAVTPVLVNVLGNDTVSPTGMPLNPASVTVTTAPGHGGTTVNSATGAVTYTPISGFSGVDTFVYRVCDLSVSSVCRTATVTVNVTTVVTAVADSATTAQNSPTTITVLANDTVRTGAAALNPASVTVTTAPAQGSASVNATTGAITYTPAVNYSGSAAFTYRVCDGSTPTPVCATATVSLTVSPNVVVAGDDAVLTPQSTAIDIAILANDSGLPGGAPLNNTAVTFSVLPANGTIVDTAGVVRYQPFWTFSGTDTFTYRICDRSVPGFVCDFAVVTITVGGNTVTAVPDSTSIEPGSVATFDVRTNDLSASGLPLAFPTVSLAPAHGTATVRVDGLMVYRPALAWSGVDTFRYRVCDNSTPSPVCSEALVTISVPNLVVAADDSLTAVPTQAATVAPLANDTILAFGAPLDPSSVTVIAGPTHGVVTVAPTDGQMTYVSTPGFSGTDQFFYRVCDGSTPDPVCDEATITVAVPNDLSAVDDTVSTAQNTPVEIDVLLNDVHAPGGSPLDESSVLITSDPLHGLVATTASGTITYTPGTNFSGPEGFGYRVCDTSTPVRNCSTAAVVVTIFANVVDAVDDSATTAPAVAVISDVLANDGAAGAAIDPTSVTIIAQPSGGTVAVDPTSGAVTYEPQFGFSGTDGYQYRVCDHSVPVPACGVAAVIIQVPNQVIARNDSASTAQNTPVSTMVLANDEILSGGAVLDPASTSIAVDALHGALTIDPDTGAITYVPDQDYSGSDSYWYQVCDRSVPILVCDDAEVAVSVAANTVVTQDDSAAVEPNTQVLVAVLDNDTVGSGGAELNPQTLTVMDPPTHGSASPSVSPPGVSYTPDVNFGGQDQFSYRICDSSTPTPVCSVGAVSITVALNVVTAVDDADTTAPTVAIVTSVLANDTVSVSGAPLDPSTVSLVLDGRHGTASVEGESIRYQPESWFSGTDEYRYRVCDLSIPFPVCGVALVRIFVANTVLLQPDSASTPQNTAIPVDVLANDSTVGGGAGLNVTTVTVIAQPSHGSTQVDPVTGVVTYQPATHYSGNDLFQYQVCDLSTPLAVCADAEVSIAVADNVVTSVDDVASTDQHTMVAIDVASNDFVSSAGAPLDPLSVSLSSLPSNGTVSISSVGIASYVPATGFAGIDVFEYQICDLSIPVPQCGAAAVTVTVRSNVVVAVDDSFATTPMTAMVVDVLANDTVAGTGPALDPDTVQLLLGPSYGSVSVDPVSGQFTYTPAEGFSGTDLFFYRVCDLSIPTPQCDSAGVTIAVPNSLIAQDDSVSTAQNVSAQAAVLANDTHADGGADLDVGGLEITVSPQHGVVLAQPDGRVDYNPDADYSGSDQFSYRICDLSLPVPDCAVAHVVVDVAPNVLMLQADSATTAPVTPTTVDVLANDTVRAAGAALDSTSLVLSADPLHGSVTVLDGRVGYLPDSQFSGEDSFEYRVCDASHPIPVCATATVTIEVPNEVVAVDDEVSTDQNTAVSTDVMINDTVTNGASPLQTTSVSVVVEAAHGSTSVDAVSGEVTYLPITGFSGLDGYEYQVCDGSEPTPQCGSAVVRIVVAANIIGLDPDVAETLPGMPTIISVLDNDVSGSGQPLDPESITITVPPLGGVAVVDPLTGQIRYTPAPGFSGTDTFVYHVCDTSSPIPFCGSTMVTIELPNVVEAVDDDLQAPAGNPALVDVLANDTILPNAAPLDPASITIEVLPAHGSVSVNPDGTILYTPDSGFAGVDSFSYRVCDRSSPMPMCATATVPITVFAVGLTLTQQAQVVDANNDGVVSVSDRITYELTVTNSGSVGLEAIEVSDPLAGQIDCPSVLLDAGQQMVCLSLLPYTVGDEDARVGEVINVAEVSGKPTCQPGALRCPDRTVLATSTETVMVVTDARLSVTIVGSFLDFDRDGRAGVADSIQWNFIVTNSGRTAVSSVALSEGAPEPTPLRGPGAALSVHSVASLNSESVLMGLFAEAAADGACVMGDLAPGSTISCTAVYRLSPADIESRVVSRTATVEGWTPLGPVSASASVTFVQLPEPQGAQLGSLPPGTSNLPGTGPSTPSLLVPALLAVVAGAILVLIGRRKPRVLHN